MENFILLDQTRRRLETGPCPQSPLDRAIITEKHQQRFDRVVKILAQPYALDRENKITKISYPQGFSTSAGLISTVLDMAKYDIAIDQNKFVTKETQQLAFTPAVSTKGESLPYGLGWFTTELQGHEAALALRLLDRQLIFYFESARAKHYVHHNGEL